MKPYKFLTALLASLSLAVPAMAEPITMDDGVQVRPGIVGLRSDKVEFRSSGSTGIATLKYADSVSTTPTITIPSSSGADSIVLAAATQSLSGKTLASPTISGTIAGAPTASGIWTMSAANIITHAPTGLKVQDSDTSSGS